MTDKTEAQPEALRLADCLIGNAEIDECEGCNPTVVAMERSAAAELRRQHAEIQQLKAQLSARQAVSNPWQQAIDHELVCLHLGVAGEATKESALKALQELIQCHVEIAINPQTNGGLSLQPHTEAQPAPKGWRLVPAEATRSMMAAAVIYANGNAVYKNVAAPVLEIEESIYGEAYTAMLSAAPPPPEREPLPVDFKGTDGINARLHYRRGWRESERAHGIGAPAEKPQ